MGHSDALAARVAARAEKLERFSSRVVSCHVVLELAGHHHRHGDRYRVGIQVGLPGHELFVSHTPSGDQPLETPYASVDRAFDEAERQLEEWARIQRGARHADARAGRG